MTAAVATIVSAIGFLAPNATAAGSGAKAEQIDWVALGDSSAAGPLIPQQESLVCTRSTQNWPKAAAAAIGANLTDVTCSGAVTGDMTGKQFGVVPPQFDALKPDTDVVTIAIGANDMSLGTVVPSCINPLPAPLGSSCKARFTAGGNDELATRVAQTAPKVDAVLDGIKQHSPKAKVFVVGYGTYWKPGGCYDPTNPIWGRDSDYLQASWDNLHAMLAERAEANGARYIDLRTPSADHGVCASWGQKWMEGLIPTAAAAPYHPNALGMSHSGATVAAAVRTLFAARP